MSSVIDSDNDNLQHITEQYEIQEKKWNMLQGKCTWKWSIFLQKWSRL